MAVIKVSLESFDDKYKFYITDDQLKHIVNGAEFLNEKIIDAKTGKSYIIADEIKEVFKIEPPKAKE